MPRAPGASLATALMVFIVAPARADDPASAAEDVDEVVVLEEPWVGLDLVDAARTTRAVTARRAEPGAATAVLGDLLEGLPGVAVQRTGPGQGAPMVRGLIGSSVLLLVDGMRVNDAMFRPAPNQLTSLVDPWSIDRVEVVRGPGSTLFGSDAMGGAINVVTPLPLFDGDDWQRRGHAALTTSSADASVVGRAAAATGRRGLGLSVGVTWQHHDDVRAGGGERLAPSAYRSLAADATVHLERPRHATTAWFQLATQPSLPRTDELRPGFGMDEPSSDEWRYQPSARSYVHLRHLRRRPLPWLRGAELHLAWQRLTDDRRQRDAGATTVTTETNHDDSLGVTARAAAPTAIGELVFGADYWFDRVGSERREATDGMTATVPSRFADGSQVHQASLYGLLRRDLGDRVTVQGGARAVAIAIDIAAADRAVGAAIATVDGSAELGAEARLGGGVAVVANLGRGFRTPNVHDLSTLGARPGNRWQVPSAELAPEHALGADVGVRVERAAITGELFGFGLVVDDQLTVVPTGEVTADGRMIVQSANAGQVRLGGVEAAVRARPWPWLELAADATWLHGTPGRGDATEPADRLPPLGGGVSARWSRGAIAVESGVRWAAAQHRLSARDADDPRIDPTGTPGWLVGHVGVAVAFGGFDAALSAHNVLDRRYRVHASGTDAPGLDLRALLRRRF